MLILITYWYLVNILGKNVSNFHGDILTPVSLKIEPASVNLENIKNLRYYKKVTTKFKNIFKMIHY